MLCCAIKRNSIYELQQLALQTTRQKKKEEPVGQREKEIYKMKFT